MELQGWLNRESPQTQEADAANLKALSMALSCSEARIYHSCLAHIQPQSPLPHPPRKLDLYAQRAILSYAQHPSQYHRTQKACPSPLGMGKIHASSAATVGIGSSSGYQLENQREGMRSPVTCTRQSRFPLMSDSGISGSV